MGGRKLRTLQAPPVIRVASQLPHGPRQFRYSVNQEVRGGPGEPPPGFLGPTVSRTEWTMYWAIQKVLVPQIEAKDTGPPFRGSPPEWTYQRPYMEGRQAPGGAVVDFVIWRTQTGTPLFIRLQTERWHVFADRAKVVSDQFQRQRLMDQADVVDIVDAEFSHDPTGQACIVLVKEALGLIQRIDPITAATAKRNRR